MASQSRTPPMVAENVQNLGLGQPRKEVQQDEKGEVDKLNTAIHLLVNPEPMREEQVQNAVKFLSHPKVKGSPVIYRRSFLEKKGLTKEEIDEAFRRVPDPPLTAVASSLSQDGQMKSPPNNHLQASTQTLQPSASAPTVPTTVVSSSGTLKSSEFHWSHVILAVGLLSISGAGTTLIIKNKIIPKLKSWLHKVVKDRDEELVKRENYRPSLVEEAAAAAKAASEAAIDVATASQEMLNSKYQNMRKFEKIVGLLNMQLQEMKALTSVMLSLEGRRNSSSKRGSVAEGDDQVDLTIPKRLYENSEMDHAFSAVKSSSPQRKVNFSVPPPNANMKNPSEVSHATSSAYPLDELKRREESFYSAIQDYGMNSQWNGDDSGYWGQQHNVGLHEQPTRRLWVPPPLPLVSMPEAAEALRGSKPTVRTETLANNQLVTPPDMASELQGITKLGQ